MVARAFLLSSHGVLNGFHSVYMVARVSPKESTECHIRYCLPCENCN